jgi:dTDP-4-amino-4,6-dideoxygalactose transaminase
VPERLSIDRAEFIEELKARNIGASVHFIPVHLHRFYQQRFGYRRGDLLHVEAIFDRIVSLPLYPSMTRADVQSVTQAVRDIVRLRSVN